MKDGKEEAANVLTHLFGAAACLVAIPVLMWGAIQSGLGLFTACAIYSVTLCMIYIASVIYHCMINTEKESLWRKIDHVCIYLFIAGSYTPFVSKFFSGTLLWVTLLVVWGIAILGISRKILIREMKEYSFVSLASYIGLGWYLLFIYPYVLELMPGGAIAWLVIGGIFFTGGVYFYINDKKSYYHTIWHLCVLLGTACHYYALVKYVV